MIRPYAIEAMPAPRYVQKPKIPLTDDTFPVLVKFKGYIDRKEVFAIDTAAYTVLRQTTAATIGRFDTHNRIEKSG